MVDALAPCFRRPHHRRHPLFRLCPPGSPPRSARVPITRGGGQHAHRGGVNRVLTVDLHSDQIQGFFDIPVDNIYSTPILMGDIWKQNYDNLMVVSPDVGGVVRARAVAKRLECDLAIIDKRRPKPNVAKVMNIIGDVKDRTCLIMDDMVDTANTLCEAANALKAHGAKRVIAYCTHAVLSGSAVERVKAIRPGRAGGDRHHSPARRRQGQPRIRQCPWPI
jgi:ribose-phosphate pyrophosphokinase